MLVCMNQNWFGSKKSTWLGDVSVKIIWIKLGVVYKIKEYLHFCER